ncbi:MAG: hypothetical protein ACFFDX_00950 [Candidatus Odinarchaeota archaeon]
MIKEEFNCGVSTGLRKAQEWQDARNFFEKAWKYAFKKLKERIREGNNI